MTIKRHLIVLVAVAIFLFLLNPATRIIGNSDSATKPQVTLRHRVAVLEVKVKRLEKKVNFLNDKLCLKIPTFCK